MQLSGKVALITGANSGIGLATAKLFAQQGAKLALLGLDTETLKQATEEIQQWSEAMSIAADVSQPAAMQKAIEQIISHWGHLDLVFANAGINGVWAPLESLDPYEWDKTMAVNLKGTFLTVKYAVPYLKRQGGAIVVNSSANGTRMFSHSGATAYACSKAAQVAFTKMIALELAEYRVRVNVVCPGAITTKIDESTQKQQMQGVGIDVHYPEGMVPLTGVQPGSAEQVAQLVLFLSSEAASHITGTEVFIDGGESLLQG